MARTGIVGCLILSVLIMGVGSPSMITYHLPLEWNSLGEDTTVITIGTVYGVESSLDMAQAYDRFGWNMISCLSSGLVEIQPGSLAGSDDILPALAESWNVSEGGAVWDFKLREEVVFESGAPFNAAAVKYTFDRNCNLTGEGLLEVDGPQLNMGYDMIIHNVTVVSEFVVRFYLKIPYAPFLQLLSIPPSYMVDPMYAPMNHLVFYSDGNPRQSHPCGLGPFLLENWSRAGGADVEISLIPNPNYWDAGSEEPKVDRIVVDFYSSSTSLAVAMITNEIDIAFRDLSASQIQTFIETETVDVHEAPGPQIQYLCFNQEIYPYNETQVRRALAAALDRTHLCDVVFLNQNIPLLSMVPSNLEYHLPSFSVYGDSNYTFSRAALQLFGYNESNKLGLNLYYETSGHYPQSQEQALVYAQDWEDSGVIDVTLNGLDWPTYRVSRNAGIMPVFIYGWDICFPDADDYAFLPFVSWLNLGYNETYPQGGVDQYNLWVEGRSAVTDMARRAAYYELQELQAQECSIVPLWQGKQFAVASPEISGIYLDITGLLRYWLLNISATTTTSTTTTTTSSSSSTTSTTTNTTGFGIPVETLAMIISLSSAAVIIIVVILLIRSRTGS